MNNPNQPIAAQPADRAASAVQNPKPFFNDFQARLLAAVCESQDGKPMRAIAMEMADGRLMNCADNLNRLLADAVNNAIESGDLETLVADLRYTSKQAGLAADSVAKEFFGSI